jgi:AcrR family transcriptional regulator
LYKKASSAVSASTATPTATLTGGNTHVGTRMKETRAVRRRRSVRNGAPIGRPRKLTREAIVEAAAAIIEQEGEGALTLRSLSGRLGVQAATIYTYFDQLREVEEAVLENVLSAIPRLDIAAQAPLREQLIDHFTAVRAAHIQHPRLASGPVGSVAWQAGLRQMDNALAQLVAAGMELQDALMAYAGLLGMTVNSASSAREAGDESAATAQRKFLASMKGELPYVLKVIELLQGKTPGEGGFRWQIGVLVDRLLPRTAAAAKPAKKR